MATLKKSRIKIGIELKKCILLQSLEGGITVTLALVFAILLALVLAVIENTRVLTAEGYVSTAADAAMETVFGGYNKELFDEYHLLGYGGYSGKCLDDLSNDLESITKLNIRAHPKDVNRGYSDLYRIEDLSCNAVNAESIATHEQFMKQVSYYLKMAAVLDISGKLLQKYKKNVEGISEIDISDKLSKTGDYERGKYDTYFAGDNGQVSEIDIKQGKEKIDVSLMEDEAKGNPLSVMKEMVQEGILSLVCDVDKLSDVTVEKREEAGDTDYIKHSKDSYMEKENKDETLRDSEVSEYLGKITESAGSDGLLGISETALDKGKAIAYAHKVFSFYGTSSPQTVKYGLEYLVAGNGSEKENLLNVVIKLLGVRMVCNFLYVIKDMAFLEKSLVTATVLVGFTGLEPLIKALQYTILLILAFEEACIDVSALLMGKSVPLVKNHSNFQMKYGEICKAGKKFFMAKAKKYGGLSGNKAGINYEQFLWLFMIPVPTEKLVMRSFDIIEFDLQSRYNKTFCLSTCFSKTELNVSYRILAMFGGKWKQGYGSSRYGALVRSLRLSYAYTR